MEAAQQMVDKAIDDKVHSIALSDIIADDEFNCRGKISPIDVIDLWKSIDQMGLLQPIVVRQLDTPKDGRNYQLVAGFRRYMAFVVGKQENIPARIVKCTQEEAEIFNLTENLQRKELNVVQESKAVEKFFKRGWTQDKIAKELKVSRVWVITRLKLLSMPKEIQEQAEAGVITMSHVMVLYEMQSPEEQMKAARKIVESHEKGEKVKATALKENANLVPSNVAPKKPRNRREMFEMIELIMKEIGGGIATRALAWASGEISEDEFKKDLSLFPAQYKHKGF